MKRHSTVVYFAMQHIKATENKYLPTQKKNYERLKREGKVYGCAGPYKVIENGSGYEAVICDYI